MRKTTTTTEGTKPTSSPVVLLLGTIADTTWRMFLPTIALAALGLYIDKRLGTAPLLAAIGGFGGLGASSYLIYRQLKKDF